MTFMTNYIDDIRILEKALKQTEKALKDKDETIKQEQEARKQEQAETKQALIKQLKILDDNIVAEINGITIEEVAKLRKELLGE